MLKDKVIFMRKPLMYVFSKNQSSGYNYNAVFVCKSDYGNRILKRIENPAHDEWKPDNWKENNHTVIEGKSAIAEIDKFIADTIAEIKNTGNNESLNIVGLEDYLYVPENIISGVEPPSKVETPFGRPSGKYTEESGSVTNEITNTEPKTPDDNENENTHVGHVIIAKPGRTRKSEEDENSEMLGTGHSRKRSRTKGGIQMGGHNFSSSVVDEGETGNYSQYIPVRFRVVAQKDYGKIYHSIIFHSPVATNRGEIELQVGGELNDEILDIIETSHGENRGNFITKLNVVEGKNIIRVRFNDNIKHAVILKAYEHK